MVFYLKYRPQKLSELDLVEVREGLEKIVKSGKVPHALLFAGPRGTGKTSAARILAKAVNCLTTKGKGEPCNRCRICRAVTEGRALDLIEIDAASNRGIDDVRSLREKIKLAPTQASFKVYIIDEVHMLTSEAFNALLKTLEEPPKHAIFILCTTAPEKLPPTILSRCTRFNFRKARIEELVNSLKRVVRGEKLKVEKGVLEAIAANVDGSFRDGQKILDQLSVSKRKITLKETKKLLGQIAALAPTKLLKFLADKDTKGAISEINRIVETGGDLKVYTQSLLEKLRRALLAKVGVEDETEEVKGIEKVEEIRSLIELFSVATAKLATAVIPQLPLEIAVVEWCENERGKWVVGSESGSKGEEKKKKLTPTIPKAFRRNLAQRASREAGTHPRPTTQNSPSPLGLDEILEKWPNVLAGVRPLNHSVEALLRATRPIKVSDSMLTIEVFYQFHKEQLEMEKCRRVVEEVAEKVLGTPVKLKCVLGKKRPVTTDNREKEKDYTDRPVKSNPKSGESVVSGDIIKAAEEIFGTNAN